MKNSRLPDDCDGCATIFASGLLLGYARNHSHHDTTVSQIRVLGWFTDHPSFLEQGFEPR
jgi:hypothetical protein